MSKELVWVSKELAEQIKGLDDVDVNKEVICSIVEKFKSEIDNYTYDVEDATTMFRRQSDKIKSSFQKVVDEEVKLLEEFWETQDNRRYEIQKKITSFKNHITTVKDDFKELKQMMSGLDVYGLDKLVDLVTKIGNMSDKDKELLSKVFAYDRH